MSHENKLTDLFIVILKQNLQMKFQKRDILFAVLGDEIMRSERNKKSIWKYVIVGLVFAVLIGGVGFAAYHFGVANQRKVIVRDDDKSASAKSESSEAQSSMSSESSESQSNGRESAESNDVIDKLTYEQQKAIVAYAVSMKSFIDGKPTPQQFESQLMELDKRENSAKVIYYAGMNAYGTLSNPTVQMTVDIVPGSDDLLFTDSASGKMSRISLDQIEQDKSIYIDSHNELSQ